MAKRKNKIKDYFNFSFYDTNNDISVRNYKVFDASLRGFFLYILLILPVFGFTYIVANNNNFSFYTTYKTAAGKHIWEMMEVSNGHVIVGFLVVGYFFFLLSIIGFALFKPMITSKKFKKDKKYIYIVVLAVMAILSILFFGLSQFEYSRFHEYYRYSLLFENTDNKFDWAKPLTQYFIDHRKVDGNNNPVYQYGWASSSLTLWMLFGQMMISFSAFLVLQNAIFKNYRKDDLEENEHNYILLTNVSATKEPITLVNNRFLRALRSFFKNDQRNLAIYVIFGSILILISNFVYSILMTSSTTNIAAVINWSYRISYLLTDLKGFINDQGKDGYQQVFGTVANNQYYGSLFTISSLQIICLGLTISVLFFFIVVLIREKKVSYKIFTIQTATLFALIIITITTMLASKVLVYKLEFIWNTWNLADNNANNIRFKKVIETAMGGEQQMTALFRLFNPNDIFKQEGFKVEWLSPASNIADAIITYSFTIGLFTIVMVNNNHLKEVTKKIIHDLTTINNNRKNKGDRNGKIKQSKVSRNRK